jgi:aminopeptidase N
MSYSAITNTPIISSIPENGTGYMITKFKEIPSMQTYLLAFLVSDFDNVANTSVIPPQRVFAKPSSISNGDANYALSVSPDVLKAFEEYLSIPYTFPKMDQVALPNFAAGAVSSSFSLCETINFCLIFTQLQFQMENWSVYIVIVIR